MCTFRIVVDLIRCPHLFGEVRAPDAEPLWVLTSAVGVTIKILIVTLASVPSCGIEEPFWISML